MSNREAVLQLNLIDHFSLDGHSSSQSFGNKAHHYSCGEVAVFLAEFHWLFHKVTAFWGNDSLLSPHHHEEKACDLRINQVVMSAKH